MLHSHVKKAKTELNPLLVLMFLFSVFVRCLFDFIRVFGHSVILSKKSFNLKRVLVK